MKGDPPITIRDRTGKFNFADPDEVSTRVKVEIPEYDFENTFKVPQHLQGIDNMPWPKGLDELVAFDTLLIGDRSEQEELAEILKENYSEIEEAWAKYREEEIEEEIEALKEEKRQL
jgi:hypothetical protein